MNYISTDFCVDSSNWLFLSVNRQMHKLTDTADISIHAVVIIAGVCNDGYECNNAGGSSCMILFRAGFLVCSCRPFFTYWVTFVQIVCYIVSVAVYGFSPIGISVNSVESEVFYFVLYTTSLSGFVICSVYFGCGTVNCRYCFL